MAIAPFSNKHARTHTHTHTYYTRTRRNAHTYTDKYTHNPRTHFRTLKNSGIMSKIYCGGKVNYKILIVLNTARSSSETNLNEFSINTCLEKWGYISRTGHRSPSFKSGGLYTAMYPHPPVTLMQVQPSYSFDLKGNSGTGLS